MTGRLHVAPLAPATPTKRKPQEAPATPEAVKVEPQLAGGESWGDGLEAIKANNVVVGLNLIQPAESVNCRPARASDEDLNESREADVVVEAPLGPSLPPHGGDRSLLADHPLQVATPAPAQGAPTAAAAVCSF